MYFNAIAFFIVYHTIAVVVLRRVRTMSLNAASLVRGLLWIVTVAAASYFFAWAETYFYVASSALSRANVWYVDIPRMLSIGSLRSEEHTSEVQSITSISYSVFFFKKKP